MARHTFGQDLTSWTMLIDDESDVVSVAGGVTVTFWSAEVGGSQYTDLLDSGGSAASSIVSADGSGALSTGTIPKFSGPAEVTEMWADAGGGARAKMMATDLGGMVTDVRATVVDLQGVVALLSNSVGTVRYDSTTSSWPERPVDSRTYLWIGPTAPTIGGTGMVDGVDLWINPTPVT